MAPTFVFAEQVRKIIRSGKKEFDVPCEARISAAAEELIRDHKIEVRYLSSDSTSVDAGEASKRSNQAEPEKTTATEDNDQLSPEVIEDIVNRVIERFYRLRGKTLDKTGLKKNARPDGDSDTTGDNDLVICRCEEITRQEIIDTIKDGFRTLNGIKRVTRAGMGLCQGQTCQRLITQILAEELGVKPAEIEPTTARGPVRPIRLAVFANS